MNTRKKTLQHIFTAGFLTVESVLYVLLLAPLGKLSVYCSFASVVLCFLFALARGKNGNLWITCGLAVTVAADYFLVLLTPPQRLTGMILFFFVQLIYAFHLQISHKKGLFFGIRIGLLLTAATVTVAVLGAKTDALAIFAVLYYILLTANISESFFVKKNLVFSLGLLLLILCDTVIGLQVASNGYLPIEEGTLLYKIIFPSFNLAWIFYLPSQVLIALSGKKK